MVENKNKECFIIMPITIPEPMQDKYRDGKDHFQHVLDCLFMPAVEKAGYTPIPPKAEGSDLIHANIIKNLETTDLVLCDMSVLNPNVFFEFGIRTALDKPVCIVKDELVGKVPFDTTILNYHEYKSSLELWESTTEVEKLTEHIEISAKNSKGKNTLWKYFGLKSKAAPYEAEPGVEGQMDYIKLQLDLINRRLDKTERKDESLLEGYVRKHKFEMIQRIIEHFREILRGLAITMDGMEYDEDIKNFVLHTNSPVPPDVQNHLVEYAGEYGYSVSFFPRSKSLNLQKKVRDKDR